MMDWDMVRAMQAGGMCFGGHTVHHPILTRLPRQQAREEIRNSKAHIEEELGRQVLSFAYPNGMRGDWNKEVEAEVRNAGYKAAFTLLNGPASWREVKSKPLAIRRVFISHKHGMDDFAAMMSPLNRLGG
jgi:peptidoglycan/xylan/chitin deacetylase (PgdA/CDA1 family)